ncbi:hypothetical protein P7K49_007299, partial [Saguinus oedipus]
LLKGGTKGGSVQRVPSGSSCGHIYLSPTHLKGQRMLDQSRRVWQQQKVLTTPMKGPLSLSTVHTEVFLPLLLLASTHARSGPSNKPILYPGKAQDRPRVLPHSLALRDLPEAVVMNISDSCKSQSLSALRKGQRSE